MHNALIVFECFHAIRNRNKACKEFGAYKLNLTKAYHRVDWGYLEGVLQRLGFHSKWIMVCNQCLILNPSKQCPFEPFLSIPRFITR
jgi:hypothetical protein